MAEKPCLSDSPEILKHASVRRLITTSEQEYTNPAIRYAHNDLYPTSILEVMEVKGDKVLVRDDTGDFWVPKAKLEFI